MGNVSSSSYNIKISIFPENFNGLETLLKSNEELLRQKQMNKINKIDNFIRKDKSVQYKNRLLKKLLNI